MRDLTLGACVTDADRRQADEAVSGSPLESTRVIARTSPRSYEPSDETRLHEKRAVLAWLWTRARNRLIEFPFVIQEEVKDPPDFSLEVNGVTRGIEVTQITTAKNKAAYGHIKKYQPKDERWMVAGEGQVLRPNDPVLGDGYAGDGPVRAFCDLVGERVRKKCQKKYPQEILTRFDSYTSSELVLYDTSHLGIFVGYKEVPRSLLKQKTADALSPPFSSVSIVRWAEPSGWVLLRVEGSQILLGFEDPSSPELA